VAHEEPMVYVVDDDTAARSAIQNLLQSVGLRAQTFGSAQEFLVTPRPDAPACLVLDVRLPGVSGLDFQRNLAARNVSIPIIFITGHGDAVPTVRLSPPAQTGAGIPLSAERSAAKQSLREKRLPRAEFSGSRPSSIAHKSSPIAPAKPSLNQAPVSRGRATPAWVWSSTA